MSEIIDKEKYFIQQIDQNQFNGDDGAVIGKYVYSMDAFFENVHFKREWMTLEQIAQKAMLVNISDAIVMNSVPKYALITVAIPASFTREELDQLAFGFNSVAKEYNILIIGGDTISNEKLDITITLISKSDSPVYRKGIEIGDLICYTGSLGSVKKDLESLLENKKIDPNSKFIKPQLKPQFFYEIAPLVTSAMDISDGLFFECERLSKINHIGFEFFKSFDTSIGCSGEEYEILFSCNKQNKEKIEAIASFYKVPLYFFAQATSGEFVSPCKPHHFG